MKQDKEGNHCGANRFFSSTKECCDICPKGKHMESECQGSAKTKCRTCEHEHFMDQANFLPNCRPCRVCQEDQNLVTDTECKADQNRRCKCKEGFFCTDVQCDHCQAVTLCPPGSGVKRKPTATSDTECEQCPTGTFSDVEDFLTPCVNQTNCKSLGKELRSEGTPESDAQCKDTPSCHGILTVSLMAGFVVILIIVLATILYFCWRTRRHSKATVQLLEVKPEALTMAHPDTELQYPTLCHDEKYPHNHCSSAALCTLVPIGHCMEMSDLECDCEALPTLRLTQDFDSSVVGGVAMGNHSSASPCQSEPQENEWSET